MTAFSKFHHFSRAQIERSVEITSQQGVVSRSLIHVTTGHRNLVGRQFLVQQVAYWITVVGLAIAESSAPYLSDSTMRWWLAVAFMSWLLRILTFLPVYFLPPPVVPKSLALKLSPLLIIVIACAFWVWTISLFAGPFLTVREVIMCIGFLAISISMTGMWPVTPIAVVVYNVVLWGALSYSFYIHNLATFSVLITLNVIVLVILGLYVFISVSQVNAQLRRSDEVDILNARLVAANSSLEMLKNSAFTALETRSAFFAQASHDFKQRLHGTKLVVLAALASTQHSDSAHAALHRLGQEVDSLEIYMHNVLDFARIESLDAGTQLRTASLQSLFQKLDLHFEDIAEEKGVNLAFRPTSIRIGTDASMLYRMLENLIANAVKFSRTGARALVTARSRSDAVFIEVWDQGPGIRPDARDRIFEAFHQEAPSGGPRQAGIGLGLAIVQRFAKRLNYKIQFDSRVGRGTVFRIIIPREFMVEDGAAVVKA